MTQNTLCQHFTCCIRPFGKPLLVKPGSIWDAFGRIVALKSPENCRVNPELSYLKKNLQGNFDQNRGVGVFRTILHQMWFQGSLRGRKSDHISLFFSFRSRSRMDRNGPETVQNAPKPHFWVILTHFGLAMACSACSFGGFKGVPGDPNRPKFLFLIPVAIDLEGIEMAFKRSKMPPNPIFG